MAIEKNGVPLLQDQVLLHSLPSVSILPFPSFKEDEGGASLLKGKAETDFSRYVGVTPLEALPGTIG